MKESYSMYSKGIGVVLLFLYLFSSIYVVAVPAYSKKAQIKQPDGSYITISLQGDEFYHRIVTEDNYVLLQQGKGYYYAIKGTDGRLISSEVLAHNQSERNLTEQNFLQSIEVNIQADTRFRSKRYIKRKLNKALLMNHTQSPKNTNGFPVLGKPRTLIVLVEFQDYKFTTEEPYQTFYDMLNKPGYDSRQHIGSANDYFKAQSMGVFDPQFDVYGPVTADKPVTYYGENDDAGDDKRVYELVLEVCQKLDNTINFQDYDLDNDGVVDNIYIYFAGWGENFAGASSSWIWPHAFNISAFNLPDDKITFDGVKIDSYGCCAELYGTFGNDTGAMGTFCHEFGHILGLPDFYDTNYADDGSAHHPETWDIMASGSYLPDDTRNTGAVPAGYTAMERYMLGWGEPIELKQPQTISLPALQESNLFLRISTDDPNEYYLLENRQQKRRTYDEYIPYHGLLIYHIDQRTNNQISVTFSDGIKTLSSSELWSLDYNALNANANHLCFEIEKAIGNDIGMTGSKATSDTPFPGSQLIHQFTDETSPSMKTWAGKALNKPITNIQEKNGIITFDFMGGADPVIVHAFEATDIDETSFTANWQTIDKADGYKIYLWKINNRQVKDSIISETTFVTLPDEWKTEGSTNFENNAITLSGTNSGTLSSPIINLESGGKIAVRAKQFADEGASLNIYYGDKLLTSYVPSSTYSNNTITVPKGLGNQVIRLETIRKKRVVVEKVSILQDFTVKDKKIIPSYPQKTDNAGEYIVTDLEPQSEYAYAIEATGFINSLSKDVFVKTSSPSNIENKPLSEVNVYVKNHIVYMSGIKEDTHITIYDNMGRTLQQIQVSPYTDTIPIYLRKGFYLLRIDIGHNTRIIKLALQSN